MGPIQKKMKQTLIDCAKQQKTITYSALGFPYGIEPRSPVLAKYLGEIGEDCLSRKEPL